MKDSGIQEEVCWKKKTKQLKRLCRGVQVVPPENGVRNIQGEWFTFLMISGRLHWLRTAARAFLFVACCVSSKTSHGPSRISMDKTTGTHSTFVAKPYFLMFNDIYEKGARESYTALYQPLTEPVRPLKK